MALTVIVRLIEREPFRWPIGRISLQKIAYFATQAGIPTGLEYHRGSYGPFAEDLKRLLTRMVNNGLITEHRRGRMFVVGAGPTYKDAVDRYRAELERWRPAIERVADLLLQHGGTAESEVLASAHFAASSLLERSKHLGLDKPTESRRGGRRPEVEDSSKAATRT